MPTRWLKVVVAVLLLPACVGSTHALWRVLRAAGGADTVWVPMLAGAGCWLTVFWLLPRPLRLYVFGHELTHALWTWLFLGRVERFEVRARSGHVVTTRHNFLVVLAPYFFPVYAVLVLGGFLLGDLFWDWQPHVAWCHWLLGMAYAFHLSLTLEVLRTRQSDIVSQGRLFSAVIIWLGNLGILLAGIPLVTARVGVFTAFGWACQDTGRLLARMGRLF